MWNPKICLHWSPDCHAGLPRWHPDPRAILLNGAGIVCVGGENTLSLLCRKPWQFVSGPPHRPAISHSLHWLSCSRYRLNSGNFQMFLSFPPVGSFGGHAYPYGRGVPAGRYRAAGVLAETLREHTQLNSCIAVALLGPEYTGGWAHSHLIWRLTAHD